MNRLEKMLREALMLCVYFAVVFPLFYGVITFWTMAFAWLKATGGPCQ